MAKKIIRFTPEQLGYTDRGKMKWQGLMLSDHSESLRKLLIKENGQKTESYPEQSLLEIADILWEAYHLKKPVTIQTNIIQNGSHFKAVPCLILGFSEDKIFLSLKEEHLLYTTLENIHHIAFLDSHIWYQKNNRSL